MIGGIQSSPAAEREEQISVNYWGLPTEREGVRCPYGVRHKRLALSHMVQGGFTENCYYL